MLNQDWRICISCVENLSHHAQHWCWSFFLSHLLPLLLPHFPSAHYQLFSPFVLTPSIDLLFYINTPGQVKLHLSFWNCSILNVVNAVYLNTKPVLNLFLFKLQFLLFFFSFPLPDLLEYQFLLTRCSLQPTNFSTLQFLLLSFLYISQNLDLPSLWCFIKPPFHSKSFHPLPS